MKKFTEIQKSGYREAADKMGWVVPPEFDYDPLPIEPKNPRCSKCGIELSPVMGYVCSDNKCPSGLGSYIS